MEKYYIKKDGQIYTGDMQNGDRIATDDEVIAYYGSPLDNAKKEKIVELNRTYEDKASNVKLDTPADEVLTWNIQKTEAEAFALDDTATTPFIDGLASARQVDRVFLINKILEKTRAYNDYMAYLTGTRQFYEDQIKMAQTIIDVEAVQWLEKA